MTVSATGIIERIARTLAGEAVSVNAGGTDPSAGDRVDQDWRGRVEEAVAVLRTMREPDAVMAAAGDPETWRAMVTAALAAHDGAGSAQPSFGPDEEGEAPLSADALPVGDSAAWVHLDRDGSGNRGTGDN